MRQLALEGQGIFFIPAQAITQDISAGTLVPVLPALISVSGFRTSQRLKALTPQCPTYLAIHTIEQINVIQSEEYRLKGGGNFARWQSHISNWHRNIYDGISIAPAIKFNELLVVSANPIANVKALLITPVEIVAVALEQSPSHRWLSKIRLEDKDLLLAQQPDIQLYEAMTHQLLSERQYIN